MNKWKRFKGDVDQVDAQLQQHSHGRTGTPVKPAQHDEVNKHKGRRPDAYPIVIVKRRAGIGWWREPPVEHHEERMLQRQYQHRNQCRENHCPCQMH